MRWLSMLLVTVITMLATPVRLAKLHLWLANGECDTKFWNSEDAGGHTIHGHLGVWMIAGVPVGRIAIWAVIVCPLFAWFCLFMIRNSVVI